MVRSLAAIVAATVLSSSAASGQGDSGDVGSISKKLGSQPLACATVASDRKLCTWHERRSHHLVCEVDAASQRTAKPCLRQADNETMRTYASSPRKKGMQPDRRRGAQREEARAQLDAAASLDEVVALIGAGPGWCAREGEGLVCGWHVVRRTPGYVTMARVADAPGKKLAVLCRFGAGGSAGAGACSAEPSGRPPAAPH